LQRGNLSTTEDAEDTEAHALYRIEPPFLRAHRGGEVTPEHVT
jgi:hypothetical protein